MTPLLVNVWEYSDDICALFSENFRTFLARSFRENIFCLFLACTLILRLLTLLLINCVFAGATRRGQTRDRLGRRTIIIIITIVIIIVFSLVVITIVIVKFVIIIIIIIIDITINVTITIVITIISIISNAIWENLIYATLSHLTHRI